MVGPVIILCDLSLFTPTNQIQKLLVDNELLWGLMYKNK